MTLAYPHWKRWLILALLVIGFGVRMYRLEFHGLWSDEGISILRSSQPLPALVADMPVEQLPGYFVLLHFWLKVAGDSDFALRFFSLWPSVLSIALLYRLGAELGDRRTGLIAAALLVANPLQHWYGQEGRTYSWLVASTLLSSWFLWRLLMRQPSWGNWLGYVLSTTLTVYLHYHGFLVPLAHTLFVIGWTLVRRDWSTTLRWVGAGFATLLLFLPWLPRALGIFDFQGWREPIDPWQIPWRFLTAYTAGEALPDPWRMPITLLYLACLVIGAFLWGRRQREAAFFLLSLALIPLVAVFLLALRQPDTHERYILFIAGPLLLLAAGALRWSGRIAWLALAPLALLIGANSLAIAQQYHDPAWQKPDFRTAAYAIADWAQPGDVILVDGPNPQLVFLHYYRGDLPVHDLRFLENADFATIDETLQAATAGARRAWEVLYFHEPGPIQFWLATQGWTSPPTAYNGVRVTLYGLPSAASPQAWQALEVPFGSALTLTQAAIAPNPTQAGDLVTVTTHWQAHEAAPDYQFSLRLLDLNGSLIQSQDYGPQNWFAPTSTWPVDAITADQRAFLLPRELPAGRYQITLRLYSPMDGVVVETPAGQDVTLGEFDVLAQGAP